MAHGEETHTKQSLAITVVSLRRCQRRHRRLWIITATNVEGKNSSVVNVVTRIEVPSSNADLVRSYILFDISSDVCWLFRLIVPDN